jgi:diadenosine tetraphosphatase ApaH/serine/threonine PP2A family protein phosphatase
LIGYGPNPNECVNLLREYEILSLSGNHDWAVLNRLDLYTFNNDARDVIRWTQKNLTDNNLAFLESLPSLTVEGDFTLAHASPRQPVWEYVSDPSIARENFQLFETPYCLVGHTHAAFIFIEDEDGEVRPSLPTVGVPISLGTERMIINPGSVGQPRDLDPRAAYAILDTSEMTWESRRVSYPIEKTQKLMEEQDFPYRLILRLEYGW